jgi:hypothetical protein
MTKLRNRKSRLIFTTADEINDRGKYRAVVIEAQPTVAIVRLAGTRTAFPVSYGAIYHLAARIAAEAERREKKATRNPRRR